VTPMTIAEGMKQIKLLLRKAEDLRKKIAEHCADLSYEAPVYGTPDEQRKTVAGWLQAHGDLLREVADLKRRISATNLATEPTIQLGGKGVAKPITEWVARRTQLAALDEAAWKALTDRNLRDGGLQATAPGAPSVPVQVRRYYDPKERDARVELYRSEPTVIDSALETVNATTQLVE